MAEQVTLKNQKASDAEDEAEKKKIESKGGKIVDTFGLIKGFVYVFTSPQSLRCYLVSPHHENWIADYPGGLCPWK